MTTTNNGEFKPKQLVPVGESILVFYSGKAPRVSTREFQGKPITEVTFWLGIADKNYPHLVGQFHPFVVRPWISGPRVIEAHGDQPRKTIQASKLYKTVEAIAGDEKVKEFAYHDASLDITAPEFDPDSESFVGEEKRAKAIHPDQWKTLRNFYVAIFKAPRKAKGTDQPMLTENGGVFWQEVDELKPLKFGRIFNEEQLQASIIWPPPKPEPKPLGLPQGKTSTAPPAEPPRPDDNPPTPHKGMEKVTSTSQTDFDRAGALEIIRGFWRGHTEQQTVIKAVCKDCGGEWPQDLKDSDLARLVSICECVKYYAGKPNVRAMAEQHLSRMGAVLIRLTVEEAKELEHELQVPF